MKPLILISGTVSYDEHLPVHCYRQDYKCNMCCRASVILKDIVKTETKYYHKCAAMPDGNIREIILTKDQIKELF